MTIIKNILKKLLSDKTSCSFKRKFEAYIRSTLSFIYNDNLNEALPSCINDYSVNRSFLYDIYLWLFVYKPKFKKINLKDFEEIYNLLADNYSKNAFLELLTYLFFEDNKFRFSLFYSYPSIAMQYYNGEYNITSQLFDLNKIGYNLHFETTYENISLEFIEKQFFYFDKVMVNKGDVVLDCGVDSGCSALHFSLLSEEKVYCIDWRKEKIDLLLKQIDLNKINHDKFDITTCLLSEKSDDIRYAIKFLDDYHIDTINIVESEKIQTLSIDDFVTQKNLDKVSFIKIDVLENLEEVLKGACNTILRFKPKLSICLSSQENNLCLIPKLLKSIYPAYNLALRHCSCCDKKTILFAYYWGE